MPKYKATAYIRLSYTDDHSSESDSVSNQRKLIENFVERNPDIEVVSEKIDDGYSGIIFFKPLYLITLAESLGGVESLVCHPASMTHASIPYEVRQKVGITDGLIRLYIGVESVDDLRADLAQAIQEREE